jgi:hypothetical protein
MLSVFSYVYVGQGQKKNLDYSRPRIPSRSRGNRD